MDGELTLNAPKNITCACGIDALSHGLEGVVASVKSPKEDVEKSMQCVKLVLENLPKLIDDAFKSDDQMIIFPAGLCSRKNHGVIKDREWGKAFIKKSIDTDRYIVPVHFIGENSKRFYRVANLCKILKIKFNLAMLFLPDELYRARNGKYKVIIGKPLPPSFFDSSKTHLEWAQWVKEHVYSM